MVTFLFEHNAQNSGGFFFHSHPDDVLKTGDLFAGALLGSSELFEALLGALLGGSELFEALLGALLGG
ncbi:MAG: hypothetical protein CUN48_08915, partial [Candidatus Thermofonsia Clade 3 bacterium]